MSTSIIELARRLDAVQLICVQNELRTRCEIQPFDFLLVIDFEATCWDKNERKTGYSEIIEFPCVLYDVKRRKIAAEFQQYVMPTENPVLSPFCKNLTGISQAQVDNGIPIGTCLMLFQKWLREQTILYGLFQDRYICCTWSDWDLGMCLRQECRRKNLSCAPVFRKWIDVRALYKEHYMRTPRGLMHSLMEIGLDFEGTPHCGLHDARNTAKLVERMIADGCMLRVTSPKSSCM